MDLADVINDCFVNVKGRVPELSEVAEIFLHIPEDILMVGQTYHWSDTVFRDQLHCWIEQHYISDTLNMNN